MSANVNQASCVSRLWAAAEAGPDRGEDVSICLCQRSKLRVRGRNPGLVKDGRIFSEEGLRSARRFGNILLGDSG